MNNEDLVNSQQRLLLCRSPATKNIYYIQKMSDYRQGTGSADNWTRDNQISVFLSLHMILSLETDVRSGRGLEIYADNWSRR